MSANQVLFIERDGLATVSLNKPEKLNALDTTVFEELLAHIERIEASTATIGCVVLRGNGRSFCAGHDLAVLTAGESVAENLLQTKVIERLANLPQPVITAVQGHCYTGGLELALAGDIILASANARFADTHAKWALTPLWGLSQRLPRRVGMPKAREMMFTCRSYTGAEAERMGLANACFPDDAFDQEVETFARSVLANSWFSLRANKRLLIETDGMPLSEGIAHEAFRTRGFGPDMQARIAAFGERKQPRAG
ncbi:MAG: enoyl-CoA hydratase/isomerase family protein [Sinobacteraceae bacterium]|nr:enoyl-CoA hydratase/isomerase family protein [Nevskiaceae bacterium]